jgi:ATP-dependent DNA helicase RecQ
MANVYEFFKYNQEHNTVTITARQFGTEKFKLEKAIYRLSQLGIVSDWVIEDFFNGTLYVEFQCLSEESLEKKIEHTVRKYDPEFKLADVFSSDNQYYKILCDKLRKGSIDKSQFIFLVLLLWSYDHFVYNRRQSQKNVYEQCSLFAEGRMLDKEFKEKLEGYFRHDKSSQLLLNMAENSVSANMWPSVFFETDEKDGSEHLVGSEKMTILRGQLSRFLESYKDNAFLNYLSGVLRLASDEFDDADGERRMAASFERLISDNRDEALDLVRKTMQLKPMFSEHARSRFARLVHEKFEDLDVLGEVNEELGDPYSYHILLAPLANRLEKLTSQYKGINW